MSERDQRLNDSSKELTALKAEIAELVSRDQKLYLALKEELERQGRTLEEEPPRWPNFNDYTISALKELESSLLFSVSSRLSPSIVVNPLKQEEKGRHVSFLQRVLKRIAKDWSRLLPEDMKIIECVLNDLRFVPDLSADLQAFKEGFQLTIKANDFRVKVYEYYIRKMFNTRAAHSFMTNDETKVIIDDLKKREVLVTLAPSLKYYEPAQKVLALELSQNLFKIPHSILHLYPWSNHTEILELNDLSENVIETVVTLYGGEAYQTLEAAKDAAVALSC